MTPTTQRLDAKQLKTEAWLFSLNAWRHAEENNLIQIIEVNDVCQDKAPSLSTDDATHTKNS